MDRPQSEQLRGRTEATTSLGLAPSTGTHSRSRSTTSTTTAHTTLGHCRQTEDFSSSTSKIYQRSACRLPPLLSALRHRLRQLLLPVKDRRPILRELPPPAAPLQWRENPLNKQVDRARQQVSRFHRRPSRRQLQRRQRRKHTLRPQGELLTPGPTTAMPGEMRVNPFQPAKPFRLTARCKDSWLPMGTRGGIGSRQRHGTEIFTRQEMRSTTMGVHREVLLALPSLIRAFQIADESMRLR